MQPVTGKRADRRVQRTRRLLHEALLSLIHEKRYEVIMVQEILDRADIGRSTFYMHFKDKDELLFSGLENVNILVKSAQAATSPDSPSERIIGFSLAMFEHANQYRAVHRALLGSDAEAVVRRYIHSVLSNVIGGEIQNQLQRRKRGKFTVSAELLTHFLVSTYISTLIWWLSSKNPLPPKEINAAYRQLVLPCLTSIFA
jgi:AcrR family transcriptional regulator